ncbi:hypothetical protein K1T34_39410 [Amycolatopsis sp. DSM 110486]|nr:hypothetical protein K1T34_39410 [Amycolatopsis sp. DSM 110486]
MAQMALHHVAVYGGVFVAGALLRGVIADGYRPGRFDVIGAGLTRCRWWRGRWWWCRRRSCSW